MHGGMHGGVWLALGTQLLSLGPKSSRGHTRGEISCGEVQGRGVVLSCVRAIKYQNASKMHIEFGHIAQRGLRGQYNLQHFTLQA